MYDAIVLAGGEARRLDGADKPGVEIDGVTLLDRVLAAAAEARRVIVVGPRRDTSVEVVWTREDPPGGGPVAALAAGLAEDDASSTAEWVLVLAADLPAIAPAVPRLLIAAPSYDVAVLERGGRRNHLAAVWHTGALRAALGRIEPAGAAMRDLYAGADVIEVRDDGDWGVDCDTWADVERARSAGQRA